MKKYLKYLTLFLPILFFIIGINFHRARYANDPDYIYLVNAVAICMGTSVGHIDNPGTTVMQLGAATIAAKHLISNPENKMLIDDVLSEPDRYIEAIQNVLLILNTLIILLLGLVAFKKTNSIWAALLFQLTSFFTANTLNHIWTKVSPEPVLFFVTTAFIITLLLFYTDEKKSRFKYVVLFSLIVGAGLGTKATFLPLMLFPFFILPKLKRKVIYLIGVIFSFVLFTIPAIPMYESMYYWFKRMFRHSGKYGHGEKGIIDLNQYLPNIWKILESNPIFGIITLLSIVTLIIVFLKKYNQKEKKSDWDFKILQGLVVTVVFGILLVAKHFHANHYLIPIILLSGVLLYFILKNISFSFIPKFYSKILLPVIVIGLLSLLAWKIPPEMKYADHGYMITTEEIDSTNRMIEKEYPDYAKIYYYPYTLNKYSALNFGDVYAKRKLLPYLKTLYPNTYFYNSSYNFIQYWNAVILLEDLVEFNGNKVLMIGGPKSKEKLNIMNEEGIPLNQIYKGRIQTIYELDTVRYNQIQQKYSKVILEEIKCDVENLDTNGTICIGSDGDSFGSSTRNNEEARSGQYSFKLDSQNKYAAEYYLDSLQLGCTYNVSVWRKADNYKGRLVVAANDAKIFYQSQNDFIRSDDNGWDLISINFLVTEKLKNETLKIYLWNTGKEVSYFDDFSIKKIIYSQVNGSENI